MSNHQKISRELQSIAETIEARLKEITGEERYGFSLCIFNKRPRDRMNYITNCNREDVVTAWTALMKAWENGHQDIPTHKLN